MPESETLDLAPPAAPKKNLGGRPRKDAPRPGALPADLSTHPGFQEEVAKAAVAAVARLLASGSIASATAPDKPSAMDTEIFDRLAMAIAEISDQGTSRKRVAPEILAKWTAERERMGDLIMAMRASIEADPKNRSLYPRYRVINKCYLNERLLEPFKRVSNNGPPVPTEITWTGVPNEYMMPVNDAASAIFDAFRGSIGSVVGGPKDAAKPLWMTGGGLVVAGDPPASMGRLSDGEAVHKFADDLGIAPAIDPSAQFVNILGTVAPPARQNYSNQAQR